MNEAQLTAWQLKPHTVQGRIAKRLLNDGACRARCIEAAAGTFSVSVSLLRDKWRPFSIAILTARDGTGIYRLLPETWKAARAGALHGFDHDVLAAQSSYNARYKPAPGKSIHELTRAALDARCARAQAGDREALGPDVAAEIARDVQRIVPSASFETIKAYLNTFGLAKARAAIGVRRDGADFVVKTRTRAPWRPGDPKPVPMQDGRAA